MVLYHANVQQPVNYHLSGVCFTYRAGEEVVLVRKPRSFWRGSKRENEMSHD